jgi:hypothetical protein
MLVIDTFVTDEASRVVITGNEDTPNAETLAAFAEGDAMLEGKIPRVSMSVEDFFKEMNE